MGTTVHPHPLRRALWVGSVVTAGVLLAGCAAGTPGGDTSGGADRSTSLVIAENEVPATFDPIQADNSTVDEVVIPAYDSLLTYEDGELAGHVASEWTVSDDGLTITLTLRDDIVFHDDSTLTADDVVYTLDRIRDIGIGVASFTTAYVSSEAVSDTEVSITLEHADATFLAALTRVYVVNADLVRENEGGDMGQSWLATNDAGSGPYAVTGYTTNQAATFERFDDYWQGFDGQAENIEFRYLTEASTQLSALQSGDIDVAMDIAPNDWTTFESADGYTVDKGDTNVVLYAFFNMVDETTSNPALREAIAMAYDYQQHVDVILKGAGNLVTGPMPSGMTCATTEGVTQPGFDLDAARTIVEENGLEGTTLTMTYLEATAEMEQAGTLLQSNLAEIGITLELQAVTYPQYAEMAASDDTRPQLGLIYAFPAFPDASALLYQNYNSAFIGLGQNWGGYSDPEVDALTNAAQTATDEAERCAAYERVQQIVSGDYVAINMANSQAVSIMNDRVENFTYRSWHHNTVDVYSITLAE